MQVYKAAKYIRLSYTDDKSNESNSVGNQRKLIEDFVSRHPEIELVSEKVDDGYSGVIFDRPAFKEMMDDIMEGKINCVIVKDLSRLGREYIETGRYMRRVFPAYGVRFIAINDNIDTLNESAGDDLTVSVKMKLYESMVNGFLDKAEFLYNKSSYSARITQLEQAVAALKEKRTDVMENRSERNRWIENFRRFSDLEELDRKAVIQLVQVITVLGKDELQIQFNYQDEYEKALALITPVQERMVV